MLSLKASSEDGDTVAVVSLPADNVMRVESEPDATVVKTETALDFCTVAG